MRLDEEARSMDCPEGVTSLRLTAGDNPSWGTPRAAVLAGKWNAPSRLLDNCKLLSGSHFSMTSVQTAEPAGESLARSSCCSGSTVTGAVAPTRHVDGTFD